MSQPDRKLWPFSPRSTIFLVPVILVGLLAIITFTRKAFGWPSPDSEKVILAGVIILSLIPILLELIDVIIERISTIEYKGIKLDLSRIPTLGPPSLSVPGNIGVRGRALNDSDTSEILDTLRQAITTEVVIIDLEDGQAWWETRLLVLLAGAVRLRRPEIIVFVGTECGITNRFQGWGHPNELLPSLLRVDRQYLASYYTAKAATQQWALVEPVPPNTQPPPPSWVSGLAAQRPWMAFNSSSGLPNDLAAEQLLAADLGIKVEMSAWPRGITLVRLQELFKPMLKTEAIDETWPSQRQLQAFLEGQASYVAITNNGCYIRLMSRITGLNTLVKSLSERSR
jgi:hypothetical protein